MCYGFGFIHNISYTTIRVGNTVKDRHLDSTKTVNGKIINVFKYKQLVESGDLYQFCNLIFIVCFTCPAPL